MQETPVYFDSQDQELNAMRTGVAWVVPVKLREFTIRLRPLTIIEQAEVDQNVNAYMARLPVEKRVPIIEAGAKARETIKKSSTANVTAGEQGIYDAQLDQMTSDEIRYLYKQYLGHMEHVNPELETMPRERLEEIVSYLKKTPQKDLLSELTELSTVQLANVILHLLTSSD